MFEPTYALHSHIARHHGHRGRRRGAGRRLLDRRRRGRGAARDAPARASCSSAARTTRREPSTTARTIERLADARGRARRAARRRRGVRRVRAVERDRARRRVAPARRRPHVLEGVVARRDPARLRGRRRAGWSRSSRRCALPYALSVPTQLAGEVALDFRAEMEARVASLVEERGRLFAALADMPGLHVYPVRARTSCCSASTATRTSSGKRCSSAACSSATSRAGRASSRCLRVTVGTPAENDAFLAALQEVTRVSSIARSSHDARDEGDDGRRHPRGRRHRHHRGRDRHPVLRPHARTARQARRASTSRSAPRATSRSTCTTRSRTSASCSATRCAKRSATRPACAGSRTRSCRSTKRSCRSRSTSRAGRSSSTTSTRSSEWIGTFDPQLAEEFWKGFVDGARLTLHLRSVSGKNGHHVIEASFKGVARARLRDAVRVEGTGVPSHQGHPCRAVTT